MHKTRSGGSVRWRRTLGKGVLDCRETRDSSGVVMGYRFMYSEPGWGPLDLLRFEHDPPASEPHHLDIKMQTQPFAQAELERLLPSVIERWKGLQEVVA